MNVIRTLGAPVSTRSKVRGYRRKLVRFAPFVAAILVMLFTQPRMSSPAKQQKEMGDKGEAAENGSSSSSNNNDAKGTTGSKQRQQQQQQQPSTPHERPVMRITKGDTTWSPSHPWDAPPDGLFDGNDTGAFENCTRSFTPVRSRNNADNVYDNDDTLRTITVSCHEIGYRAPLISLQNSGPLLIGVLSAAAGSGPRRRNYIRSTWGSQFPGIFFLVAGPWDETIRHEFLFYQDMIWIDEEEIYKGEDSVLTYKTMSYFTIAHRYAKDVDDGGFRYAMKTDDDSYVNIERLYGMLFHGTEVKRTPEGGSLDFFGQCPQFQVFPSRDPSNKWSVSYEVYPEPAFPLYCQGAGFTLSRSVLHCAEHVVPKLRYQPFEDAAVGLLAERCGYAPTMVEGVRVFRSDTPKERSCVNNATPMEECYKDEPGAWPPNVPNMNMILVQHRVGTREDMVNIHKSTGQVPKWVDVPPNKHFDVVERAQAKIAAGVEWTKMRTWSQV